MATPDVVILSVALLDVVYVAVAMVRAVSPTMGLNMFVEIVCELVVV